MSWYKAGTIAISGTAVTGTGTNWSDNKMGIGPGQALLIPAAGTVRMFEILRVDSDTLLTLTSDAGSVAAGQAYAIMSFYTDSVPDFARRLSAQLSYYQSQMDGWQQIMTGTGSLSIAAPDGTQVTISSFKKLTDDMNNKAGKVNGVVPVDQGGTGGNTPESARVGLKLGNSATLDVGSIEDTVAAGDDSRFSTINGKTGGNVIGPLYARKVQGGSGAGNSIGSSIAATEAGSAHTSFMMIPEVATNGDRYGHIYLLQDGVNKDWFFNFSSGTAWSPGGWKESSDIRIKDEVVPVPEPLEKMKLLRGCTWVRKDDGMQGSFGIGFIAQEVQKVFPDAALKMPTGTVKVNGEAIGDPLSVDAGAIAAALHHEAILTLMEQVEALASEIDLLKKGS